MATRAVCGVVLLILANSLSARAADAQARPAIGAVIPDLEFKDIRYLTRTLSEMGTRNAYVIVATSTTCPVGKKYLPVLASLEKTYRAKGVQFVALNVGPDDSIREMAADAVESGAAFPFVKDRDGKSAQLLGLVRTPEVVVLDSERHLRYRGRIDDQFRVSGDRSLAAQHPLRDALDAVLAGEKVKIAETPVDGCLITHVGRSETAPLVTYAEHVAPILKKHCQGCHRSGTEAPFSLATYRDAQAQAAMIAEVVDDQRMPPWYGSERHGSFINERGLSASEREIIVNWVRGGMRKGESEAASPSPSTPKPKWSIGEPDLITATPFDQHIPATGFVDYRFIIFPHVFREDTWVDQFEILPDNPKVVHHANLAYIKLGDKPSEDNFITGRVPGGDPMVLDPGTSVFVPRGSILVLQCHFTTTGKPERTKIEVGLKFPRVPVQKRLYHQQVHTSRYAIPPFDPAHPVTARRKLDFDATGVGLFSHMHVRGKDMTFLVHHPDGRRETLLLIPNYSFDWQHSFRWASGKQRFSRGSTFEVIAHFDNSEFNPYNPNPKDEVRNGDQTFQEMMYGFYFYTRDDEHLNIKVNPKTGVAIR